MQLAVPAARFRLVIFAGLLLPACAVPGGAAWSDLHASAFGSVIAAGMDASGHDVTVRDSSGGGFDFDGDLEIGRSTEVTAYYGARVGFAPLELAISQFGYDGANEGDVLAASRFAGVPITGDLAINSELDLSVTKMMLGVDLLNTPVARVAVLAGIDFIEFDRFDLIAREAKAGSGGGGGSIASGDVQTVLEDESSVVPMLGLRADARVPYLGRVGAEVSGLQASLDDADLLYLDFDLAAHWEPWDNIELVLGYRAVMMEVEGAVGDADLNIDLNVNGPYFGISVYW